ncbi:MAG: hypothetical protein L3J57_01080 [Desulfuromusa sp.]|nr:hypothetical protein [Desulfuromusa sp.]
MKALKVGSLEEIFSILLEAAMDNQGYRTIPKALFESITFLAQALPKRSAPTWLELLFGAMLTQTGFVTDIWLAIRPRRH